MRWTTEFPSTPGWYWLRRPDFEDEIVKVEDAGDELLVWSGDFCYENLEDAEWAGPIPAPQDVVND